MKKFEKTPFKTVLTGLPVSNHAFDFFSIMKFLSPKILAFRSFGRFKERYGIKSPYGDWYIGYKNLPELKRRIEPFSFFRPKEKCVDLPPKVYEVRKLEMTQLQKRLYKEAEKEFLIEFEENQVLVGNVLVKLMKLSQITSGFFYNESHVPVWFEENSPKILELKSLLEEFKNQAKIVIWARFIEELNQIQKILEELKFTVERLDGAVKDRFSRVERFRESGFETVLLSQLATGKYGLNFTCGEKRIEVIYFSNSYSLSDRVQSEARTYRIGSGNSITYTDLIVKNSIDEQILEALRKKKSLGDYLLKKEKDESERED